MVGWERVRGQIFLVLLANLFHRLGFSQFLFFSFLFLFLYFFFWFAASLSFLFLWGASAVGSLLYAYSLLKHASFMYYILPESKHLDFPSRACYDRVVENVELNSILGKMNHRHRWLWMNPTTGQS